MVLVLLMDQCSISIGCLLYLTLTPLYIVFNLKRLNF